MTLSQEKYINDNLEDIDIIIERKKEKDSDCAEKEKKRLAGVGGAYSGPSLKAILSTRWS